MPTHAELSSRLLSDAADFFRTLSEQNEDIQEQMAENAGVFDQMADLIAKEPEGIINEKAHGELAGKLLGDAAVFFRTLAEQNEPIRDQMIQNAEVYEQIGDLVKTNPLGVME